MASQASSSAQAAQSEATMIEHLDVSYGPHERNKIDFYQSTKATKSPRPPILIFIHGGAWRTGSRKDHAEMARRLISLCGGNVTVALVDYRLTQPKPLAKWSDASKPIEYDNRHPAHLEDVYAALRFLLLTPEDLQPRLPQRQTEDNGDAEQTRRQPSTPERYGYNDQRAVLMGHSVGAWMAAAVLLNPRYARWEAGVSAYEQYKKCIVPEIADGSYAQGDLIAKINSWILVDGIYDLISLLDEYPQYRSFVAEAFPLENKQYGSEAEQLRRASVTSWTCHDNHFYCCSDGPVVHMAHSLGDELLSTRQTDETRAELVEKFKYRYDGYAHERAKFWLETRDWGTHDGMLTNEDFLTFVAKIVKEDSDRVADAEKQCRRGMDAYYKHYPRPERSSTQSQEVSDYDLIGPPPPSRPRQRGEGGAGEESQASTQSLSDEALEDLIGPPPRSR